MPIPEKIEQLGTIVDIKLKNRSFRLKNMPIPVEKSINSGKNVQEYGKLTISC